MLRTLMILAALATFQKAGIHPKDTACPKHTARGGVKQGRQRFLKVNWKPITIFPEEAVR